MDLNATYADLTREKIKRLEVSNAALLAALETIVEENYLSGREVIARARASAAEAKG